MTEYLKKFFTEFEYGESDAEYLLCAYGRIADNEYWKEALSRYDKDMNTDFKELLDLVDKAALDSGIHLLTAEILLPICLTKKAKEYYREKGLDDKLFYDSMLDIRYKLEECKLVKGVIGTFVAFWFDRFFNLTRFCFGRLQFELVGFKYERYVINGKVLTKDDTVINVHIPRTNTPLDKDSCDKAYAKAREFFKNVTGKELMFVCSSWLLFPENKKLTSPKSNIYRFISEYEIVDWCYHKTPKDLWRLFDTDEQNPDRLPANTSLRRSYIQHLKEGKMLGWGYGVKDVEMNNKP